MSRTRVTEVTYFRWRKEYGGLRLDQAKRLKELERENARLKRAVTKRLEPTTEMMSADAGLHADQARRHVSEP